MGCSGTRLIDERVLYTASVTFKPLRGGVSDPGAAGALYRYRVRMTSTGPSPDLLHQPFAFNTRSSFVSPLLGWPNPALIAQSRRQNDLI